MRSRSPGTSDLFAGIVVDNFAGGGGASLGIELALGRPADVAINHDAEAIAMHMANHPHTRHLHADVWDVNPVEATRGRPVLLAWFSPDCKHFSKAKGSKPVDKRIRGLAWVVLRWAARVRPSCIMLENVEEFADWGPLTRGRKPCKRRRGETFRRWVQQLSDLGYDVEWRELRACDYGAPTIRKRLFLIARCDGQPIIWPEPTHGDGLRPYRTAAECIQWAEPCPSIFGRKRPLAEKTLRRIASGIRRYVIDAAEPFIVPVTHQGGPGRVHATSEPFRTITSAHRGEFALVAAFLAKHYGGVVGHDLARGIGTITAKDHHALCTSHLLKLKGTSRDGQPVTKPLHTVQALGQHYGEVRAFLIKYYGQGVSRDVKGPLHTITTRDRIGLVMVRGQPYQIVDIGMRMLLPRELYRAQGFPDDYVIDTDAHGNRLSKTAQVRMCGNSVCPDVARALVEANVATHRNVEAAAG